jgi:hypothetical protein
VATAGAGGSRTEDDWADAGERYQHHSVGISTLAVYIGVWRMWCGWRSVVGRLEFVQPEAQELQVRQLMAFGVYLFEDRRNSSQTVQQKMAAVSFFHRH